LTPPRPGAPGRERLETPQALYGTDQARFRGHPSAVFAGSVRRGGACVGSVPEADKEGGRLLVVELGESPLERPRDGRCERPPITFVRLAAHRELRQRVRTTNRLAV
jgi:hypothetical protein